MMRANEFYDEQESEYHIAKIKAFKALAIGCIDSYIDSFSNSVFEPTMVGLADDTSIEFEFPSLNEWLDQEYKNYLGDLIDQAYEIQKEKEIGLL